jgi:hypothetical protein
MTVWKIAMGVLVGNILFALLAIVVSFIAMQPMKPLVSVSAVQAGAGDRS